MLLFKSYQSVYVHYRFSTEMLCRGRTLLWQLEESNKDIKKTECAEVFALLGENVDNTLKMSQENIF